MREVVTDNITNINVIYYYYKILNSLLALLYVSRFGENNFNKVPRLSACKHLH